MLQLSVVNVRRLLGNSGQLQTNLCSSCMSKVAIQCQEAEHYSGTFTMGVSGLVVSGTLLVLEELPESLLQSVMV